MSELADFQNFLTSAINNTGSGANYTISPPSNVILPPNVNLSQVGGGVTPYIPLNPKDLLPPPAVPPPAINPFASRSSSSSSSSAPIDRYGTYRNYKF
jgi:hypothetical protein